MLMSELIIAQNNSSIDAIDKIAQSERDANGWKMNRIKSNPMTNNYDLKYHRMEFYLDPAVDSIRGKITSYFAPVINGFNQISFDMSDTLVVDSVLYHGTLVSYIHSSEVLQINLPNTISINTLDSISVYYEGVPVSTGFGSFIQTTHSGVPIIWTLSEPYGAQDWMPCKNSLTDKIDSIDVIITTPQINRVASNGLLVEEIQSGTNKIYHWKHRHPIATYLIGIAVTNYIYYSNYVPLGVDSFPVLNYVFPESDSVAKIQTPDIVKVIELYDSLLGVNYPFADEKYGHAQFGWGGGMEHQTMSFVTSFGNGLIAHECAHQWFGDKITLGSWTDIWLNEGFATFMEGLSEKYLFPSIWNGMISGYIDAVCSQPGGSVWVDDTTSVSRIFDGRLSYVKGCLLLRMLEWKLGDSTFFTGLKNYLNDPQLAYNYVRTSDLKHHLELVTGQNLTSFFDEWFYGQGYPSYNITWNQIGNTVSFTVNQTTSHISVPFFEMPIPIEFKGATNDTIIVFNNTYSGQPYSVNLNYIVQNLEFDPDNWIISHNNMILHTPGIFITPNPFTDNLSVKIESINTGGLITVTLNDMLGNIIWTRDGFSDSFTDFSIPGISNGAYILHVRCNDFDTVKKIIKQ